MLGSLDSEHPKLTDRGLFLKISNQCDHDTSTSRTDRQTDRRTDDLLWYYCALFVASRSKNQYTITYCPLKKLTVYESYVYNKVTRNNGCNRWCRLTITVISINAFHYQLSSTTDWNYCFSCVCFF